MKTERAPLNITRAATGAELYTAAEVATSIALRTLHSKTGLQMYADLITAYHNDRIARAAADIQTTITAAEHERDTAREMARTARAVAERMTITEDEREAAEDEAAYWTALAEGHADEAKDTEKAVKGVTFSDRADMTQEAAAALVETWTTPAEVTEERRAAKAAAIGKEADELSQEEAADLQTAANFRAAINAARRASTKLAHPDSKNSTTTKAKKLTAAEVAQWVDMMGGTGADIRRPAYRKNTAANECWDTVEYKDGKTVKGWHMIRHYRTIRRYDSYEMIVEETGNEPAADLTTDKAAAAMLCEIVSRANLTATERKALVYYSTATAEEATPEERKTAAEVDRAAAEARAVYMDSRAAAIAKADSKHRAETIARAEATAANKATAARWNAALTAAGYKSERSRQRGQAAIIAALLGAAERATTTYTTATREDSRPDIIGALLEAAGATTARAIVWHDVPQVLEAAAPCVTGWRLREAKRAAESAAAIEAAHRARKSRIDNSTPEAQARAEAGARAYAEKQAARAAEAKARAEAKAKADRLAEAKAAAIRHGVFTNSTNWETWQKWTEAQRAVYMEYLNARA